MHAHTHTYTHTNVWNPDCKVYHYPDWMPRLYTSVPRPMEFVFCSKLNLILLRTRHDTRVRCLNLVRCRGLMRVVCARHPPLSQIRAHHHRAARSGARAYSPARSRMRRGRGMKLTLENAQPQFAMCCGARRQMTWELVKRTRSQQ